MGRQRKEKDSLFKQWQECRKAAVKLEKKIRKKTLPKYERRLKKESKKLSKMDKKMWKLKRTHRSKLFSIYNAHANKLEKLKRRLRKCLETGKW